MKRIPFIQGQVELALSLSQATVAKSSAEQHIVVADIGSDHGYLTQSLLESGVVTHVIVTDIAEQPLQNAKNTLGTRQEVEYRLCQGMEGNFSEADIAVIAGMGGDLIAHIIETRGVVKDDLIFVLQPMTEWEKVWNAKEIIPLWSAFVSERGKHYRVIVAMFAHSTKRLEYQKALAEKKGKREDTLATLEIPYIPNYARGEDFTGKRSEVVLVQNAARALEHMEYMEKKQHKLNAQLKQAEDVADGVNRLTLLQKAIEILHTFC